jgi:hypothetical protein
MRPIMLEKVKNSTWRQQQQQQQQQGKSRATHVSPCTVLLAGYH